ncbi:hypothetical protein FQA39_LY01980 [Lamprigera yunnana]|nr:hypothetical protein FQA39_LY01980 [Lamprigera yunnana]
MNRLCRRMMEFEFSNGTEESSSRPKDADEFQELFRSLSNNAEVLCKSQQRDEGDISVDEKVQILMDTFHKSKGNFLLRFGKFLTINQSKLFEQFENDVRDGYEIKFHLKNISEVHSKKHKLLRNRRYAALKRLAEKNSYFSETEMMKRNPLLYEQLIGQYMSTKEKLLRDRASNTEVCSLVHLLMNGIEKEQMENKKKAQENVENDKIPDDSSSSDGEQDISCSKTGTHNSQKFLWGEINENKTSMPKRTTKCLNLSISCQEKQILKEEFISTMYENFLDGKDDDFDYGSIDHNEEYDNLEIIANDEEEKYFDSEEPEDMTMEEEIAKVKEDSSEDELDMYMNTLNQHPAVLSLSEDMKKL